MANITVETPAGPVDFDNAGDIVKNYDRKVAIQLMKRYAKKAAIVTGTVAVVAVAAKIVLTKLNESDSETQTTVTPSE